MKRSTLIVVLIALTLGAYGAYDYFYKVKDNNVRDEEETSQPAFTFKSEDVAALNITSNNQPVVLESNGSEWTIKQPVQTQADQSAVNALVSAVASATIDRTLVMTPSLQNGSGLATPAVTLELKLKNGTQHKVVLGRNDPTEANVYGQIDQNPNVLLLPASLLTSANKTLNDLRSKEIVPLLQGDLTSFTIKNQNLTLTAEKNNDDRWLVKEPVSKKDKEADTSKPFSVLTTQATEVIDNPDAQIKGLLAKPVVEANFNAKDNKAVKLYISTPDGDNVYVRVDGRAEIFKASKSLLESLNFKLTDIVTEPTAATTEKKDTPENEPTEKPGQK